MHGMIDEDIQLVRSFIFDGDRAEVIIVPLADELTESTVQSLH